ncbi:hypothetical protein BT69DRAFT_1292213 [Atractiella rhizophila]|nr:hypothetical protein BT69DRAFT_1292213 [Atractiella rhizophila]
MSCQPTSDYTPPLKKSWQVKIMVAPRSGQPKDGACTECRARKIKCDGLKGIALRRGREAEPCLYRPPEQWERILRNQRNQKKKKNDVDKKECDKRTENAEVTATEEPRTTSLSHTASSNPPSNSFHPREPWTPSLFVAVLEAEGVVADDRGTPVPITTIIVQRQTEKGQMAQ